MSGRSGADRGLGSSAGKINTPAAIQLLYPHVPLIAADSGHRTANRTTTPNLRGRLHFVVFVMRPAPSVDESTVNPAILDFVRFLARASAREDHEREAAPPDSKETGRAA